MIAVVHLLWGPLGPTRLREFLGSYRRHSAGVEHELVILFNGVGAEERPALLLELEGVEHTALTLQEPVQDLVAYRQAAARLPHERLCFLNSYSVILADDWLAKLDHALDQPATGIAAATGSWASLRSLTLNGLRLPNAYRDVVPDRSVAFEEFRRMQLELEQGRAMPSDLAGGPHSQSPRRAPARSVMSALEIMRSTAEQLIRFEGFPAVHVRTNAFIVDRAVFGRLRVSGIGRKIDAYSLESGRANFTRQLRRMGLAPLLVDRDGRLYESEAWPQSATFWQSDQEGLMIADNQTAIYANGGIERRRLLSALAWGARAEPRMLEPSSGTLVPDHDTPVDG